VLAIAHARPPTTADVRAEETSSTSPAAAWTSTVAPHAIPITVATTANRNHQQELPEEGGGSVRGSLSDGGTRSTSSAGNDRSGARRR